MKLLGILITIICFLLLVTGHEFGHFSVAKILGMRVNEFSVGMGPKIWQKQKGETKYSLRAVPLGGYCMLEGDENESDDPRSFSVQPAWAKILVFLAGPFVNVVIGILMFAAIFCYVGTPISKLAAVVPGSPAEMMGIQAGDTIKAVDGAYYDDFTSIRNAIQCAKGHTIKITFERNGREHTVDCGYTQADDGSRSIGIYATSSHDFGDCLKAGVRETAVVALDVKNFISSLFKGNAHLGDVSSVVGVVAVAGDMAETGGLINVIYLIALVSANLGYMNLLPIPALDGGRILFTIIRCFVKGEKVARIEAVFNTLCLILLLLLSAIIIFKDIIGLIL